MSDAAVSSAASAASVNASILVQRAAQDQQKQIAATILPPQQQPARSPDQAVFSSDALAILAAEESQRAVATSLNTNSQHAIS